MTNNSITNVAGPPGEGSFCERYLDVAGDLAGVGKWFLVVALMLGVAAVVVKAVLDFRTPATQANLQNVDGDVAATLVTALKGLVESLSAAPTWLAIFAAGLAILWGAGHLIPEKCEAFVDDKPAQAGQAQAEAGGNVSASANVSAANVSASVPGNIAPAVATRNGAR